MLKALAISAMVIAFSMTIIAGVLVIGEISEPDPFAPISFVIPALIQFEDGSVPRVEGVDGPAIRLPEDANTAVLPFRWAELNTESYPVPSTFNLSVLGIGHGIVLEVFVDSPRDPFVPGTVQIVTVAPLLPAVYSSILSLADQGICESAWVHAGSATPAAAGGVETPWYSENYTVVASCSENY